MPDSITVMRHAVNVNDEGAEPSLAALCVRHLRFNTVRRVVNPSTKIMEYCALVNGTRRQIHFWECRLIGKAMRLRSAVSQFDSEHSYFP